MERSGDMLTAARGRWQAMPPPQRRLLGLCLLALLVLSGVSLYWTGRTDWRTLYTGLEGRDAATVQQQLAAAAVPFQTSADGTALQVPAEQLDKARVAIAAQGLPQSGRLGFELFDKPNWVGSEFDERVNFQRALEGELEHTIGTLSAVRSARVHLVMPRQGAFSTEDLPAKASAVLKLRRSNLPRQESDSIRNLIAGAVEGLHADAVTLVDADGHVDFSPGSTRGTEREDEAALSSKLTAVLEPLAGAGNVHATVNVSYVEGSEEHTDEVYDPQSAIPVSTQRSEQTSQATRATGIAGTGSNTPAAVPVAAGAAASVAGTTPAPAGNASNGQTQTSHEESSSYAVSRHVTHTQQSAGRVRRVAAAIVINDRVVMQGAGGRQRTTWVHRSPDEMKRMTQLAQAAVGFEDKRGDQVVVENVAFSGNEEGDAVTGTQRLTQQATELLRAQPTLLRTLATCFGLVLIGMLVLRPLTRHTTQLLATPTALLGAGSTSAHGGALAPGAPFTTQHIFDRVTQQIKTEPQNSTRLIESWMGSGTDEAEG